MLFLKRSTSKSNIVTPNFSPPTKIYRGSVSYSINFESHPSLEITYTGCTEVQSKTIKGKYISGETTVIFEGVKFVVASVSVPEEYVYYKGDRWIGNVVITCIDYYETAINREYSIFEEISSDSKTLSISKMADIADVPYSGGKFEIDLPKSKDDPNFRMSLQTMVQAAASILGKIIVYRNGISLYSIGSVRKSYPPNMIREQGGDSTGIYPYFNDSILTWQGDPDEEIDPDEDLPEYKKQEPEIIELVKQSEDFNLPPLGTLELRDLSNNANRGGPTKEYVKEYYVDQVMYQRKTKVNGFRYTSADIVQENGILYSSNPELFWTTVEELTEERIFEQINSVPFRIYAKDPNNPNKQVKLIVHPDYKEFVNTDFTDFVVFKSNAEYLTNVITTGYKHFQMVEEDEETGDMITQLDASDPDEAKLIELMKFAKLSVNGKTQKLLAAQRALYDKVSNIPAQVVWRKYDELSSLLKTYAGIDTITDDGQIGILIPDPNYIEPFLVRKEQEIKQSFWWTVHPIDTDDAGNPRILTTGEETYNYIERTPTNEKMYSELNKGSSSQNASFRDVVRDTMLSQKFGILPQAETKLSFNYYDDDKETQKKDSRENLEKKKQYVLNSKKLGIFSQELGDINIQYAKTKDEALTAAELSLRKSALQVTTGDKTVAWYEPFLTPGKHSIDIRKAYNDPLIVMGVQITLKYGGDRSGDLIQSDGTKITVAYDLNPSVTITEEEKENDNQSSNQDGNPQLKTPEVESDGRGNQTIGELDVYVPNRRRFTM